VRCIAQVIRPIKQQVQTSVRTRPVGGLRRGIPTDLRCCLGSLGANKTALLPEFKGPESILIINIFL